MTQFIQISTNHYIRKSTIISVRYDKADNAIYIEAKDNIFYHIDDTSFNRKLDRDDFISFLAELNS